jgi:CBS domain containing-hemolysin-like protein
VGGWVTLLLGRIPKQGDSVQWHHMTFTVEAMRRHRVHSVFLTQEPSDE